MTETPKKAGGYIFGGIIAVVVIAGGFLVIKEII